jgi:hypothetical protein
MSSPLGIATGDEAQDKSQVEHLDGGRLEHQDQDHDEKAAITAFQSSFESKYAGERGGPLLSRDLHLHR